MKKKLLIIGLFFYVLLLGLTNSFAQSHYLKVNLNDGTKSTIPLSEIKKITFSGLSNIENNRKINSVLHDFTLFQNYPNPFNPVTHIQFTIREKSTVTLNVYNIQGRLVQNLAGGEYPPGSYQVLFNGSKLPSGIYFYQLEAGGFTIVKKMILLE